MFSTKQKELAIQMWQEIKDRIEEDPDVAIELLKLRFCAKHGIRWKCNCILCEKYHGRPCSSECPLMRKAMKEHGDYMEKHDIVCGCSNRISSDHAIAIDLDQVFNKGHYSLEKRQKAIDNIIEAIKEA